MKIRASLKQLLFEQENPAKWLAMIYIFLGLLWIFFSDWAFAVFLPDAINVQLQTYKGLIFVLASGFFFFFSTTHLARQLVGQKRRLYVANILLKTLKEDNVQPLIHLDAKGFCVYYNACWLEFTNLPLAFDQWVPWMELIPEDEREQFFQQYNLFFPRNQQFSLQYRLRHAHGNYCWVKQEFLPLSDSDGNFRGYIGLLFDMTETKRLEERIGESSRRYGYLFDNNPHPMLVYDTQSLNFVEVNKAAEILYGYSREEFSQMTLMDIRPPEEVSAFLEHLSVDLPSYQRSSGWRHMRKDGTIFDVEIIGHALPEINGRTSRLVIASDISEQKKTFQALKEGEQRFISIFEHAPEGAFIISDKFEFLSMNPAACQLLGVHSGLHYQYSPFQFLLPESVDVFNRAVQHLNAGQWFKGQMRLRNLKGMELRAEWYAISFIERGEKRFYFSFRDVSERYRIQEALKESERMLSNMLSNLPGVAYRCCHDASWTMLFISQGISRLTGYEAHQLLNNKEMCYSDLIHPDDRRSVRAEVNRSLNSNHAYEVYYRIVCQDQQIKWVWEQGIGVFKNDGSMDYIEGLILDVTKEKRAMDQVDFQTRFLERIVDNIPFPLFYKDLKGQYIGCNKAFCEYLKRDKKQVIGKTVHDLFDPEQANLFQERDRLLMQSHEVQQEEAVVRFSDGRLINAIFYKSVFFHADQSPAGIIGVYVDITERARAEQLILKQMEELSQINAELEKFSYTVSHDLRGPLVTIKGFLGMLRQDLSENNQDLVAEDLDRIDSAAGKMGHLLEDLLELSRLGRIVNPFQHLAFAEVAAEAAELLHAEIQKRNCVLVIQEDMPWVWADRSRLREVVQNLLENALKFMGSQADPRIEIGCDHQDDMPVFFVKDNGMGIETAYQQKIFNLFTKLDNETSGTGIGLALVKRILDFHGGRVWVESAGLNLGSVFYFTLNTEKYEPGMV